MDNCKSKIIQNKTYTNLEKISNGSFGIVYKANCEERVYAIKEFKFDSKSLAELKSFIVEYGFVQKIAEEFNDNYPIVKVFGYECIENTLYYAMELGDDSLGNHCLKIFKSKNDSNRIDDIWIIYSYILKTLLFLQSIKRVHRDIKPHNFLVFDDNSNEWGFNIKLIDFGTIRKFDESSLLKTTAAGTFAYMAPESFKNEVSQSSDIWSLGIILYQLIYNGEFPDYVKSPQEILLFAFSEEKVDFPTCPEIYSTLCDIAKKCLAKKYKERMDASKFYEYTLGKQKCKRFEIIIPKSYVSILEGKFLTCSFKLTPYSAFSLKKHNKIYNHILVNKNFGILLRSCKIR